jgi:hypothetical protein
LAVLGLVLTVQLPAQASARMQFGEIWYNSPGSDRGGATSLNHEWVQLHNTSGALLIRLRHLTGACYLARARHSRRAVTAIRAALAVMATAVTQPTGVGRNAAPTISVRSSAA